MREVVKEAAGDRRRDQSLTGSDRADGLEQVVRRCVLEKEAGSAGLERSMHQFVEIESRENQHPWSALTVFDNAGAML